MTISELLRDRSTLDQFDILQRADRMWTVGRYYGGLLTADDLATLLPEKPRRN